MSDDLDALDALCLEDSGNVMLVQAIGQYHYCVECTTILLLFVLFDLFIR